MSYSQRRHLFIHGSLGLRRSRLNFLNGHLRRLPQSEFQRNSNTAFSRCCPEPSLHFSKFRGLQRVISFLTSLAAPGSHKLPRHYPITPTMFSTKRQAAADSPSCGAETVSSNGSFQPMMMRKTRSVDFGRIRARSSLQKQSDAGTVASNFSRRAARDCIMPPPPSPG